MKYDYPKRYVVMKGYIRGYYKVWDNIDQIAVDSGIKGRKNVNLLCNERNERNRE